MSAAGAQNFGQKNLLYLISLEFKGQSSHDPARVCIFMWSLSSAIHESIVQFSPFTGEKQLLFFTPKVMTL